MPATEGFSPLRLPVGMNRSGWICSTDSPPARRRRTVWSMLSVMTGAAVLALACGGAEPFQGGLADVLPLGLRHRGEEREQQLPRTGGVVNAGQWPGEHLQGEAVGGEVVSERGEFGGVAAEPLHLVHGEDDPAVRGVRLDLPRGPQRHLELGPYADVDAGADLLAEDLVPRDAVLAERVEPGVKFLPECRASRVADADVRARQVRVDGRRRRAAGPPWSARTAVGWGRHTQRFLQPGHHGEAAGVVGGGRSLEGTEGPS